jgi:acetolactate synthase-1/2/3 large subunit
MGRSCGVNGAESLVHTLLAAGVDTCFANPGTSEMHFVAALDRVPGMRCVLGLQENVVTGMADGYFRVAGKPARRCCIAGRAGEWPGQYPQREARAVGHGELRRRPRDLPPHP